jgi:hypothetical protein
MNTLDNLNRHRISTLVHVLHCISEMARSPLVESRLVLYEEWWTEKGKLIFLMPRPAAIYIDFGATSDISPLHASTGRSPV